jgi:4-hydroxybenzoate polyprenyltransferase
MMRVNQWSKNLFVFAPVIFSSKVNIAGSWIQELIAFGAFSVCASAVYTFNDILDVEADRKHETKRVDRPIAAGKVPVRSATWFAILLLVVGLTIGSFNFFVLLSLMGYVLLNLAYTLRLKHLPILDIFSIATGFVLRVVAGAAAAGVEVSSWMAVTTFSLALFLAVMKRKAELNESSGEGRKVIRAYSKELISTFANLSASAAVVFYSLYCLTTKPQLVATVPIVLFGIMRYAYLNDTGSRTQRPTEAIFTDFQLVLAALLWSAFCIISLTGVFSR